mgnify:CR=1 FL=1
MQATWYEHETALCLDFSISNLSQPLAHLVAVDLGWADSVYLCLFESRFTILDDCDDSVH